MFDIHLHIHLQDYQTKINRLQAALSRALQDNAQLERKLLVEAKRAINLEQLLEGTKLKLESALSQSLDNHAQAERKIIMDQGFCDYPSNHPAGNLDNMSITKKSEDALKDKEEAARSICSWQVNNSNRAQGERKNIMDQGFCDYSEYPAGNLDNMSITKKGKDALEGNEEAAGSICSWQVNNS